MTNAPTSLPPARSSLRRSLTAVVAAVALTTLGATTLAPAAAAARPGPTSAKSAPATIERANPYVGQVACDPTLKPGAKALADLLVAHYGTGYYGVVRQCSSGGTSEHKEGRAIDWMLSAYNTTQASVATDFLNWLTAAGPDGQPGYQARRLGVMYVIWNKKTWATYRPEWRDYTGSSPHTDHIHISLGWNGAMKRTSWWTGGAAPVDYGPCVSTQNQVIKPYVGPNLNPCPKPAPVTTSPTPTTAGTHTVVAGDTLWNIASRYGTTVSTLRTINALTSDTIHLGQILKLPAGATTRFADVPGDHPFAADIAWLTDRGITKGVGDGTVFAPRSLVERQQMAGFLHRLSGESYTAPKSATFADVGPERSLYASVEWLVDAGITKGVGGNLFDPLGSVQRQHMAAFLFRMSGDTRYTPPARSSFSDVPTSHRFYREISWLAEHGVTKGIGGGRFGTESPVERQHMAAFLHRFSAATS